MAIVNSIIVSNKQGDTIRYRIVRERHYESVTNALHIKRYEKEFVADPDHEDYKDDAGRFDHYLYQTAINDEAKIYLAENASLLLNELKIAEAEKLSYEEDIVDGIHIGKKAVALAFLRKAYAEPESRISYRKFTKFNDYRLDQGWSINQVIDNLMSEGLTTEEWDLMKARYLYLSSKESEIIAYRSVISGDIWRV